MNSDDRLERYNIEIQCWINAQPKTLARLRKFYKSMVSIHLGGEGLMEKLNKTIELKEAQKIYKEYKTNYPNKMKGEQS